MKKTKENHRHRPEILIIFLASMTTSPPHEEEWGATESLSISLPPGPLGEAIQRSSSLDDDPHRCRLRDDNIIVGLAGQCCVVSSKSDPTSPLEVNDVILSLSGITLGDVTGGVGAWVILFGAFAVRNVVVLRRRRVSVTLSEVGVAAAEARAPHPPLLDNANKKHKNVVEVEERVERGIIDTAGVAADAATKKKRLDKTKDKAFWGGYKKKIPKLTGERNGRGDDEDDDDNSLAAVATGVGKSNGDEALDDDDGEYEDNEEDDDDDDRDFKEEEEESISNKTDDNPGDAGALLHDGLHVVQNHNQQCDNLGSNFVGLTSYLALHYEPPLGPFSEYVAFCTICFI
jgi:hypothetical protein